MSDSRKKVRGQTPPFSLSTGHDKPLKVVARRCSLYNLTGYAHPLRQHPGEMPETLPLTAPSPGRPYYLKGFLN
ncbi:MAG: hypothetical protein HQL56_11540 [Magnetococcales bacterium]|nr:hypothetical protein [Magnetococcales bacterium]